MDITCNLAHIPTLDGVYGIKPEKAGRLSRFFRDTLFRTDLQIQTMFNNSELAIAQKKKL